MEGHASQRVAYLMLYGASSISRNASELCRNGGGLDPFRHCCREVEASSFVVAVSKDASHPAPLYRQATLLKPVFLAAAERFTAREARTGEDHQQSLHIAATLLMFL